MQTPDENKGLGGYDPVAAFEFRRQIFNTVQEIQQREHEALAVISKSIESRKRDLLVHLSRWLLDQRTSHPSHNEVQALCGCYLQEWLQLQSEAQKLEAEVSSLERAVEKAHAAYRAEEPWGHVRLGGVAEMLASEDRRQKLQALNQVTVRETSALQAAQSRLQGNLGKRQQYGKQFLRSCLTNIRRLEESSVFGPTVQKLVREMNTSIRTEWARYETYNRGAMQSAVGNLERLWTAYFGGKRNG